MGPPRPDQPAYEPGWPTADRLRPFVLLVATVLVVAALYWARPVLQPVALATLVAFVLSPAVGALQRRGLGRAIPVVLVAALVSAALGIAVWAMSSQLTELMRDLPGYTETVKEKIAALRRANRGSALDRAKSAMNEVVGELDREAERKASDKPVPVVVKESSGSLLDSLPRIVDHLANAGLVLVLAVFILLEWQELRNRLIRVLGYGRLTLTTKALDEAGSRISQYLLTQSMMNGSIGVAFGIALLLIGVPYALLWAFVLAVARFVPFVGVWIAVLLPTALSLAVFKSWVQPALVVGSFLVFELLLSVVIEPVLLSHRAGVSKVALLVAVGFWTWLWGPLGLVLAMPLTVCLVVLARHVPELDFLAVLLGDEPVMETSVGYYQRLLAMDPAEAEDIVEERLATDPIERVFDEVIVAGLLHARHDRARARLSEEEERSIVAATRGIVEALPGRLEPAAGESGDDGVPAVRAPRALAFPVRDESDHVALLMFRQLVSPKLCVLDVLGPGLLSGEIVARVEQERPVLLCLAALPPGGLARTRLLLKRLAARFPDLRVLVGRWGATEDTEEDRRALVDVGASHVSTSLAEARDHVLALLPVLTAAESAADPVAAGLQDTGSWRTAH